MTIKIIDPVPSPEVLKQILCRNCGVKLQYTPNDIEEGKSYDYSGSCDLYQYIKCPNCNTRVMIYN